MPGGDDRVGGPPDHPAATFVGEHLGVPCADGIVRPYRDLDTAASTPALTSVADRVTAFLPTYASVHRGTGAKSRASTAAYEEARGSILRFAGRGEDDLAIICRNTTEAINHLAYRIPLESEDVVVTTVVEHHANLLPWARRARLRAVACTATGRFEVADVCRALDDAGGRVALLAFTAASNVTGWLPPVEEICAEAHARGIRVVVDGAQLAAHRPLPQGPDFVAFSGHKTYAPFGAGTLIGPRAAFTEGDPFLAGGGAVDLVDIDEVLWTEPPEREEAGSPNVVGAVAFGAALDELGRIGWEAIEDHEARLAQQLRSGLAAIDGVRLLGPPLEVDTLALASFTVEGMHHALVAARLSAEWGIGVRHGCFCAHPYLLRLLGIDAAEMASAREAILRGDRRRIPGAVRASCGLATTSEDVDVLLGAVSELAGGLEAPVDYTQDVVTGDFHPSDEDPAGRGGGCALG